MKTIKEWLETIEDEEIRESALRQADADALNDKAASLLDAIWGFEAWTSTVEGHEFWSNYCQTLLEQGL